MLLGGLAAAAFEASMRADGADVPALKRAGTTLLGGIIRPGGGAAQNSR